MMMIDHDDNADAEDNFHFPGKIVNFFGANSVAPTSSLKMRNCQKKLGSGVFIYMVKFDII